MAARSITIDGGAYERLCLARLKPDEPFSQVIMRAKWDTLPCTAAALLGALATAPLPSKETMHRLEEAQRQDRPRIGRRRR
jgi:hypothetical protein